MLSNGRRDAVKVPCAAQDASNAPHKIWEKRPGASQAPSCVVCCRIWIWWLGNEKMRFIFSAPDFPV